MWWSEWPSIWHILLVGSTAYATLVVLLRITGKRTLGKLNAFDLVATIALGSVLASAVTSPEQSWALAVAAMLVLIGAQFIVAQVTTWLPRGRWFVTAEPTLVVRHGEVLQDALRRARLTQGELAQAVRSAGVGSLRDVGAVVLETDGSLSVIPATAVADGSCLVGVTHWSRPRTGGAR